MVKYKDYFCYLVNNILKISMDEKKYAELREIELNETLSYIAWIKEGKVYGEKKKQFEIAKNLLAMGLPFGQISQGTELSIDKIKSLSAQIK